MNIGKIRNITEENGKIYIHYYSGIKRELKNKYLYYTLMEYIKRVGDKKSGSLITLLDIAQRDVKTQHRNKNTLFLWKLRNICKANNINYIIHGETENNYLKISFLNILDKKYKNILSNFKNVIIKDIYHKIHSYTELYIKY